MIFDDEKRAYDTYIKECGHDRYFEMALELCKKERIEFVLGFSAGASVAYRLSCVGIKSFKEVVCFYPSQIRNHLDLNPIVKTSIIFAKKESSFDIKEVSDILIGKTNTSVEISSYEHGFMNEKSINYKKEAFNKYIKLLSSKLNKE